MRACRRKVLVETLAGNRADVVTITAPTSNPSALASRYAAVLSARVHPGEANSSWMMEGVLRLLMGDSPAARLLRERFVFKIVPMLNPDGVVVGNYRCSLAGTDLNRRWRRPSPDVYPTIAAMRRLLSKTRSDRKTVVYCDFHGHSRQFNAFTYGCEPRIPSLPAAAAAALAAQTQGEDGSAPSPVIPTQQVRAVMLHQRATKAALMSRVFPSLLYRQAPCLTDRIQMRRGRDDASSSLATFRVRGISHPLDQRYREQGTEWEESTEPPTLPQGNASAAIPVASDTAAPSMSLEPNVPIRAYASDATPSFSLKHCTYHVSASKRGTGRVVSF